MLGADLKALGSAAEELRDDFRPKPGNLRNLATGRGIAIGDPAEKVRRIMGAATWQGLSKYTAGERVWTYHRKVGTDEDGVEYCSLFRIRHGKVAGIELTADMLPG